MSSTHWYTQQQKQQQQQKKTQAFDVQLTVHRDKFL